MSIIHPTLTGCAGEHFVAYRLSAMGYLVALTKAGSPSVDLMVGTPDGQKTVTVQVKTSSQAFRQFKKKPQNSYWAWHVGAKATGLRGERVFYAFVDLKQPEGGPQKAVEMPEVFIVPANIVAEHLDTYPKGSTNPTDFWFGFDKKEKEEWNVDEGWRLIEDALGICKAGDGREQAKVGL